MSNSPRRSTASGQTSNPKRTFWLGAAVLVLLALFFVSRLMDKPDSPALAETAAVVKDNDLIIPLQTNTKQASFFPVDIGKIRLEVLAVQAPDGSIRTAFNTCQVCYDSGRGYYIQQGEYLVCQNCGNEFSMSDVEIVKGGCNPVPIGDSDKTVDETNITVSKDYLTEASGIFANWKS